MCQVSYRGTRWGMGGGRGVRRKERGGVEGLGSRVWRTADRSMVTLKRWDVELV